MPTPTYFTEPAENGRWRVVQSTPTGYEVMSIYPTKKIADLCRDLWRIGAEVKAARMRLTETDR